MRKLARGALLSSLATLYACAMTSGPGGGVRWWKGNTHTHTLWSDGDAAPDYVADWYKSHGYQFLVLTDHNILAEGEKWVRVGTGKGEARPEHVEALKSRFGADKVVTREREGRTEFRLRTLDQIRPEFDQRGRFLFIKGEEISDKIQQQAREIPIHHNSVNHVHLIKPPGGQDVREVLQRTMQAIKAEMERTGKPILVHVNHPNFGWALTPDDIAYVLDERFFEVYNGHRGVHNYGDETRPAMEPLWDHVLTLRLGKLGGDPLYAFATDDAHHYQQAQAVANPGRGWVMVRSADLTPDAITQALLAGDFYASSGVVLEDVESDAASLTVRIAPSEGVTYVTRFVGTRVIGDGFGPEGEVFQATAGTAAAYRFRGDELYVRAQVVSSRRHPNGYDPGDLETAWVQPVVVRRISPAK